MFLSFQCCLATLEFIKKKSSQRSVQAVSFISSPRNVYQTHGFQAIQHSFFLICKQSSTFNSLFSFYSRARVILTYATCYAWSGRLYFAVLAYDYYYFSLIFILFLSESVNLRLNSVQLNSFLILLPLHLLLLLLLFLLFCYYAE